MDDWRSDCRADTKQSKAIWTLLNEKWIESNRIEQRVFFFLLFFFLLFRFISLRFFFSFVQSSMIICCPSENILRSTTSFFFLFIIQVEITDDIFVMLSLHKRWVLSNRIYTQMYSNETFLFLVLCLGLVEKNRCVFSLFYSFLWRYSLGPMVIEVHFVVSIQHENQLKSQLMMIQANHCFLRHISNKAKLMKLDDWGKINILIFSIFDFCST